MTALPRLSRVAARIRMPSDGKKLRLPIAAILVAGFGSLTLLAVAAVLALGLLSAGRNTLALLNDKADLALKSVAIRVRHQLDPAHAQVAFLGGLIEGGVLDPDDDKQLLSMLTGALAATPQVTSISFIGPDYRMARVSRQNDTLRAERLDQSAVPETLAAVAEAKQRQGPYWAPPIWSAELKTSMLNLRYPVRRHGEFVGMLVVATALSDLSRFLSELFVDENLNAFVLYDREHVLAHQNLRYMELDFSMVTQGVPLPLIQQVDDPILLGLLQGGVQTPALDPQTEARLVTVGQDDYLFLLRPLEGYGTQPWTVGIAVRLDEVAAELERLWRTGLVGLAILLTSVAAALLVGRRISRQIERLAGAAATVGSLDFRTTPKLPDSRFRELAHAAEAFNTMVAGLRWFETYVPKKLVLRLMSQAESGGLNSEERQVTVMFTDIRGFSALAENLGAAETAALLNAHFGRIAACIEAEGGTVDKFIGDAVMAFWGAPELQEDHAVRALAAARRIVQAMAEDNAARQALGKPPIRIRVGLHTGPVVVGNIGSKNRLNYTIVGDTVNIAQRIEEYATHLKDAAESEVVVLTSNATAALVDSQGLVDLGLHRLRGRSGPVELFRLEC